MGLAQRGLGRNAEAEEAFEELLALDPSHLAAQQELRWMRAAANVDSRCSWASENQFR